MTQLYLDLDGVLADFDTGYERLTGRRPNQEQDDVDWQAIGAAYGFYRQLPPMSDLHSLWSFAQQYDPIILTGVPHSIPDVEAHKRQWCSLYLGDVKVICCASRDKCLYAAKGDILVDDRPQHQHLWESAGGVWVTHTSAAESIRRLRELLS